MNNRRVLLFVMGCVAWSATTGCFAQTKPDLLPASEPLSVNNAQQRGRSSTRSLASFVPVEVQGRWKAGTNFVGKPCNIGGIEYADGIGVEAGSELRYSLDGSWRFFQAWVGLDLASKGGLVRFQVFADGELVYDTGMVRHGRLGMNPHRAIGCRVPVDGIHELRLRVTGDASVGADWADARLWATEIPLPDPARFSNPLGLLATPPMGWNSWCGYGTGVDDAAIRRNADGLVRSGMKDLGYQYVVIDDWWEARARDKDGNLVADPKRFPEGIKALADYVHARGLKFGIYTDAKSKTCGGLPGSYGYYEQDAERFAEWGVDFVKVDWNDGPDPAPAAKLYTEFGAALARKRMVYNICEWGKNRPWDWAREAGGQLWRTTYDLIDRWDTDNDTNSGNGIVRMLDQNEALGAFAGPGGWNDLDQLFAGLYGQSWQSGTRKKRDDPKYSGCSVTEYRAQMSLWCLLSAPLIAGCDLTEMDPATLETLTNAEAIAVNQDPLGVPAWRAQILEQREVWQKPLANGDVAVGLFNRGDTSQTISASWRSLGIAGDWFVRDLWDHKNLGAFRENYSRVVAPHEVVLLRLSRGGKRSEDLPAGHSAQFANLEPSGAAKTPAAAAPKTGPAQGGASDSRESRWSLGPGIDTVWKVDGSKLPHSDFIEQGGRRVGQIVRYTVDRDGALGVTRTVVWPSLRIYPNDTHGSFIQTYGPEPDPVIKVDGRPAGAVKVSEVVLDGTLIFRGTLGGLDVRRVTFPSLENYAALDRWTLTNSGSKPVAIDVAPLALKSEKDGPYGMNVAEVTCDAPAGVVLAPGKSLEFAIRFSARPAAASGAAPIAAVAEEVRRRDFIAELNGKLRLETPDPVLNRAFAFAKWRVAEAINDTRGGPMLAPGNGRYYAATWCNDNVEYAGPFFPFLGDAAGIAASLNAYRHYIGFMKPDYHRIPCSVVAEGTGTWGPFDRGDAAMYAYGASRFCLALGDRAVADELWKGIEWTLEYCRRKLLPEGVVASDKDELEGRLPAGKANLTTSSLYYGGLRSAAVLGRSLGKTALAADYDERAGRLAKNIEAYFGATVEGFASYRYYDGNTTLRSWICMPLSMGIFDRKQGTVDALFSPRMWTPDGLASQSGDKVFWDRSTLYAFRSVFQAGETAKALDFLGQYTRRRLLGEHVPYAVEAYPEGGQGHLSSESGLYCRIFTEGLFGILPIGLDRFQCTPRLPDGWPTMALRSVKAFGGDFDVVVSHAGEKLRVQVTQGKTTIEDATVHAGETIEVTIPNFASGQNAAPAVGPAALNAPQAKSSLPAWNVGAGLFSSEGSWLLLRSSPAQLELFDSAIPDFNQARVGTVAFRKGDAASARLDYSATPVVLSGKVADGTDSMRVLLFGKHDALVETTGLGARVSLDAPFSVLSAEPGSQRGWRRTGPAGRVAVVVLQGSASAALNEKTVDIAPTDGRCRFALRIEPVAEDLPEDWREVEQRITSRWVDFRKQMPPAGETHVGAMEQAWLNIWSSYVPPTPPYFHGNTVLMSKFRMNALWPWDHCFNALALGLSDPDRGFEQFAGPFWNQLPDGALPDKTTPGEIETRCTKPPIHGWALGKLMDRHPLSTAQLEFIYPKLRAWTEFWFTRRDSNHNGIPGFAGINRGWESGWDNSSAVDHDSAEFEAPELQAYLILQMRTLARLADQSGRTREAEQWRSRAAAHLDLFQRAFWKEGRLCLRRKNGGELDPRFTSLEPLLCLVLGDLLKPELFAALVAQLDSYKTDYGLASEMPSSPRYEPDGYWLGPVWAPAMYLVADGLKRGGRADLAAELAGKYDRLIATAGGYYENFDAKTGRGLRAPSYTWSGSVHVLFLHEFLR